MHWQTFTDIAVVSRNNLRRLPLDPVISLSNVNPYVPHTFVQMRMYLESSGALAEEGCRGAQASETCAGAWEGFSWRSDKGNAGEKRHASKGEGSFLCVALYSARKKKSTLPSRRAAQALSVVEPILSLRGPRDEQPDELSHVS